MGVITRNYNIIITRYVQKCLFDNVTYNVGAMTHNKHGSCTLRISNSNMSIWCITNTVKMMADIYKNSNTLHLLYINIYIHILLQVKFNNINSNIISISVILVNLHCGDVSI